MLSMIRKHINVISTFCFLMTSFVNLSSANAAEAWETALRLQLNAEKNCQIKSISKLRRFELAGKPVIEGKVLCMDEREFDFSWKAEKQKFEIRACEPVVC